MSKENERAEKAALAAMTGLLAAGWKDPDGHGMDDLIRASWRIGEGMALFSDWKELEKKSMASGEKLFRLGEDSVPQ